MKNQYLFEPIPVDKFDLVTKDEVVQLYRDSTNLINQMRDYIKELEAERLAGEQKSFLLEEQTILIKHRLFGKSSEKSLVDKKGKKTSKPPRKRIRLPSERHPEVPVIERDVALDESPACPCCQKAMADSGLTEDIEYLHVIPKQYYVVREKRHKYRCSHCHSSLVTSPAIPRIKPGSSYSDEMVIDIALSKYSDLIPIDRYVRIAAECGLSGLSQNTLIQSTHNLANFLEPVVEKIKDEVLDSDVVHADETTHRMLERSEKSKWYLWGFSSNKAAFFEARDTRSGDVAIEFLTSSLCRYLVSDVYSGYNKAVRESNIKRKELDLPEIKILYCNAHARRKFVEASHRYDDESQFFIWCYKKIYRLEKKKDFAKQREWQELYYMAMERFALRIRNSYSKKSTLVVAINYFLKNYDDLRRFLIEDDLPIDNNSQERLLRRPVVGRKTWYGNHSPKGAETLSAMFTLVETCRLNKVNPREYFPATVKAIHEKREIFTPSEFASQLDSK